MCTPMFILLAAVIQWLCAKLIFSLRCLQRLFIHRYPNVRDGDFNRRLGTRSQAASEILGENAICLSVVEYFSGSFAAGLWWVLYELEWVPFVETDNPWSKLHLESWDAHILVLSFMMWDEWSDLLQTVTWLVLQYEGAAMEDGKGRIIWDTYNHMAGDFHKDILISWECHTSTFES